MPILRAREWSFGLGIAFIKSATRAHLLVQLLFFRLNSTSTSQCILSMSMKSRTKGAAGGHVSRFPKFGHPFLWPGYGRRHQVRARGSICSLPVTSIVRNITVSPPGRCAQLWQG